MSPIAAASLAHVLQRSLAETLDAIQPGVVGWPRGDAPGSRFDDTSGPSGSTAAVMAPRVGRSRLTPSSGFVEHVAL